MPRLTVIMPVLNGMPYLTASLASLAAQDWTDFELVAWDNGSTDGTVEELRRWIGPRLRGEVVVGRPLPLGASRRELVSRSGAELVAVHDADDVSHPARLGRQVAFLDAHPAIAWVASHARVIDEAGTPSGTVAAPTTPRAFLGRLAAIGNPVIHSALTFRRAAVLSCGNYRDVLVEDYDLLLRGASRLPFASVDEVLVDYRVHARNTTTGQVRDKSHEVIVRACWLANVEGFLGIDREAARALVELRCPSLLRLLDTVARHHARILGVKRARALLSPELVASLRGYANPRDRMGRLVMALLARLAR